MRGEPRHPRAARRPRRQTARRRGFTLVEMLVSVTLVLMMMLMFAEIYGLAQQTMSTQKGIAENDQKARILASVIRRDLETRTFRSVYPFKLEPQNDLAPHVGRPIPEPGADVRSEVLQLRRGYFSISEGLPGDDTDDVLQLTVKVDQPGYGGAGDRLYGGASAFTSSASPAPAPETGPEYDDGVLGNSAGMSGAAEVAYFLRNGNLFRSVLLVREPYLDPASDPTPDGFISPTPFWGSFDYSVYRRYNPAILGFEPRFHGPDSLDNTTPIDPPALAYFPDPAAVPVLRIPEQLGVPHLRFGHQYTLLGNPLETAGGGWVGRFTVPERSSTNFAFPAAGWSPFDGTIPAGGYTGTDRRGVDLMLTNVHSFDIQVWDDVVRDFVDLGHDRTGTNPYTGAVDEPGFYHSTRLRAPIPKATLIPGDENYYYDHPDVGSDYGNRYDTWHPRMFVHDGVAPPLDQRWRNGRAPYRPQRTNPDPNAAAYNEPPIAPIAPTIPSLTRESRMAFADHRLDDDGDGLTVMDLDPGDSDAEAPLRAVRIVVRYLDVNSGQMRQSTIETSLID